MGKLKNLTLSSISLCLGLSALGGALGAVTLEDVVKDVDFQVFYAIVMTLEDIKMKIKLVFKMVAVWFQVIKIIDGLEI